MDNLKKDFARRLLGIKAIKLQPNNPFTWASGWKSPFYCDNRKTLSYPELRNFVKLELTHAVLEHFPEAKAVDMESCAIAHTCHIYGIPFISFRIISDIPLRDTDASMYHNFWSTIAENSFQITRNFIESL